MTGRIVALAAAVVFAVAGCGVPDEDEPREVDLPRGAYPTFGATPPAEAGAAQESLCLVRDERLVRIERKVPTWPTIETQLQHLLAGPTDAERSEGLTSRLAGTTGFAGVRLARGHVTVEVADAADEGAGRSDEALAFGQIVCTLTSRPDVVSVSFVRDGQPMDIPRADGSLSSAPLTDADYADLMAR